MTSQELEQDERALKGRRVRNGIIGIAGFLLTAAGIGLLMVTGIGQTLLLVVGITAAVFGGGAVVHRIFLLGSLSERLSAL